MPYPEKLLAEDEEIVEHLHPHWLTLLPAICWFLLVCAGTGVALAFLPAGHTAHQALLLAVLVLALLLVLWLTVGPLTRWRSTHYVFTTHRVLIRRGVLKHVGRDIALSRISDVAYEQTLLDRIFAAGTLRIESAGEHGQETLVDLPHANEVQQTLNQLIDHDSERRGGYYPRAYDSSD
ncbi:MAG TPA: PH domain-containing protein [Jatrophihabitans sp.]|nr:PH domain-containing protein [Jatrophihabitans sp.]